MSDFETVAVLQPAKKNTEKIPKLMWSKNPQLEEIALTVILNKYKAHVNQKSVAISIWESIAKEVVKVIDPALKGQAQSITGPSVRGFFRNLKKSYLEYTKDSENVKVPKYYLEMKRIVEADEVAPAADIEKLDAHKGIENRFRKNIDRVAVADTKPDALAEKQAIQVAGMPLESDKCELCEKKFAKSSLASKTKHFGKCLNAILENQSKKAHENILNILKGISSCPHCKDVWSDGIDVSFKLVHLKTCSEYHTTTLEKSIQMIKIPNEKSRSIELDVSMLPMTPKMDGKGGTTRNAFDLLKLAQKNCKKLSKAQENSKLLSKESLPGFIESRTVSILKKSVEIQKRSAEEPLVTKFSKTMRIFKDNTFNAEEKQQSLWEVGSCQEQIHNIPVIEEFSKSIVNDKEIEDDQEQNEIVMPKSMSSWPGFSAPVPDAQIPDKVEKSIAVGEKVDDESQDLSFQDSGAANQNCAFEPDVSMPMIPSPMSFPTPGVAIKKEPSSPIVIRTDAGNTSFNFTPLPTYPVKDVESIKGTPNRKTQIKELYKSYQDEIDEQKKIVYEKINRLKDEFKVWAKEKEQRCYEDAEMLKKGFFLPTRKPNDSPKPAEDLVPKQSRGPQVQFKTPTPNHKQEVSFVYDYEPTQKSQFVHDYAPTPCDANAWDILSPASALHSPLNHHVTLNYSSQLQETNEKRLGFSEVNQIVIPPAQLTMHMGAAIVDIQPKVPHLVWEDLRTVEIPSRRPKLTISVFDHVILNSSKQLQVHLGEKVAYLPASRSLSLHRPESVAIEANAMSINNEHYSDSKSVALDNDLENSSQTRSELSLKRSNASILLSRSKQSNQSENDYFEGMEALDDFEWEDVHPLPSQEIQVSSQKFNCKLSPITERKSEVFQMSCNFDQEEMERDGVSVAFDQEQCSGDFLESSCRFSDICSAQLKSTVEPELEQEQKPSVIFEITQNQHLDLPILSPQMQNATVEFDPTPMKTERITMKLLSDFEESVLSVPTKESQELIHEDTCSIDSVESHLMDTTMSPRVYNQEDKTEQGNYTVLVETPRAKQKGSGLLWEMSRATAKVDSVKESSSKSRILESSPNAIPKLDKPNTPKQTTSETNQNAMPDYEEMTLSELKQLAKQYGIKESTRSVLTQKLEQIWGILNANSQEPNYITDHPTLISEFIQKNREMYKKVLRYESSMTNFTNEDQKAALAMGLNPNELSVAETRLLGALLRNQGQINAYLTARNFIIKYWHKNYPNTVLSINNLAEESHQQKLDTFLVHLAFQFLDRYRYINYGILKSKISLRVDPKVNVLIIGAGIAGLTTARELHNIFLNQMHIAAPRIIVLESRQRIGGRIFTFPLHCRWNDSKSHSYFDLGPWVISDSGPLKHVVSQIGSKAEEYDPFDVSNVRIYDIDGSIVTPDNCSAARDFVNEIRIKVEKQIGYLQKSTKPYSSLPSVGELYQDAIDKHPLYKELTPAHLRLVHWFLANIEAEYGVDMDDLSVFSPRENIPKQFKIPGGLGQLPHALAYGASKDYKAIEIFCDHKVEKLALTANGIDIVVNGTTWSADAAVLACPITTLNQGKIAFTPRLPEKKTNAMNQVKMGVVNKVCLVFPRIFWPLHLDRFGSLSDMASDDPSKVRGRSFMFINMYHETQLPCLAVVLSGQAAINMEEESDNDVVYEIMDRLCLMFPNEHPLPYPIETVITRWSKDTYSGGSNCYLKHHGIPGSFDELLMDSRRLYMAGEHASNIRPGTIEAAIVSGRQAARKVADQLLGIVGVERHNKPH